MECVVFGLATAPLNNYIGSSAMECSQTSNKPLTESGIGDTRKSQVGANKKPLWCLHPILCSQRIWSYWWNTRVLPIIWTLGPKVELWHQYTKSANVCLKRRRSTTPQVSIDGDSIDQTTKAKYLVLIVDSRLAFGDHITNTVAIYNANRASCFDCSIWGAWWKFGASGLSLSYGLQSWANAAATHRKKNSNPSKQMLKIDN